MAKSGKLLSQSKAKRLIPREGSPYQDYFLRFLMFIWEISGNNIGKIELTVDVANDHIVLSSAGD
jgi:hypothetical protein